MVEEVLADVIRTSAEADVARRAFHEATARRNQAIAAASAAGASYSKLIAASGLSNTAIAIAVRGR